MKKTILIPFVCLAILFSSCAVLQLANLARCQFSMKNVSDITWAGINLSNINGLSDLSLDNLRKAREALKNKNFGISCNINVNAKNDTKFPAKMIGYDYELYLEDYLFATGNSHNKTYSIQPQTISTLSIPLQFDIAKIIKDGELGSVINLVRNLTDYGKGEPSQVKIRFTPYMQVGEKSQPLAPISLSKTFQ